MQLTQELTNVLKGKQVLIFDFDGTIADTSPLHAAAFERVLSPLGILVDYHSIAGMKTVDAMLVRMKEHGVILRNDQIRNLVLVKQKLVRKMIREQLHPLPGVDRFLKCVEKDFRLSIATSGSRGTVEEALSKLGYLTLFDPVICAEDVDFAKPNPQIFEKVLLVTGYKPKDALVFEDSDVGLEAARAAGIESVRINEESWLGFSEGQ